MSPSFPLPLFEIVLKSNTEQAVRRGLGEPTNSFSLLSVCCHIPLQASTLFPKTKEFLLTLGFWISNIQLLWIIYNSILSHSDCTGFSSRKIKFFQHTLPYWNFMNEHCEVIKSVWSLSFLISTARLRNCLWSKSLYSKERQKVQNPYKHQTSTRYKVQQQKSLEQQLVCLKQSTWLCLAVITSKPSQMGSTNHTSRSHSSYCLWSFPWKESFISW